MKRSFFTILIIAFIVSFAGCTKKEEPVAKESPQRQSPIIDDSTTAPGHGIPSRKTQFQIVVPPEVKEGWTSVTIVVNDKQENTQEEFVVPVGGTFDIPNSNLTVKTGPFLPDFKMNADTITSASNEPNNPAVGIAILEDGNKLFPTSGEYGWLYSKFPTVHSFQHKRYSLTLKSGTKK